MNATSYVIPAPPQPSLPVVGEKVPIRSPYLVRRAQLSRAHPRDGAMTSGRRRSSSPSTPTCWCLTAPPFPIRR
jgi:hypothetical protein